MTTAEVLIFCLSWPIPIASKLVSLLCCAQSKSVSEIRCISDIQPAALHPITLLFALYYFSLPMTYTASWSLFTFTTISWVILFLHSFKKILFYHHSILNRASCVLHWTLLFIHSKVICIYQPRTPSPSLSSHTRLTASGSLISMNLFLFWVMIGSFGPILSSTCKWHHLVFVFIFLAYFYLYDNL